MGSEKVVVTGLQHLHHLLPFKQRFVVFKCYAEHTCKHKIFSQEQGDNTINVWLLVKSQYLVYNAVSWDPQPYIHSFIGFLHRNYGKTWAKSKQTFLFVVFVYWNLKCLCCGLNCPWMYDTSATRAQNTSKTFKSLCTHLCK